MQSATARRNRRCLGLAGEPRDDRADGLVVDAQALVEAVNCVAAYTGLSTMICTLAPAVEAQSTR